MMKDGGLFLMEVLIDKVSFLKSPCFSDKDFRTCVTVTAPSVEPLEICDDDPGQCLARSGGPFVKTFNIGKSCLFSLKEEDITKAMTYFPIEVLVYKSLPCGCLPTKIVMGQATIDMTKEFVQSRNKYLEDPERVSCHALKDEFQIVSPEGEPTGAGPPILGADRKPSVVDRSCNPQRQYQTADDPCVCGAARVAGVGKAVPGTGPPCQHGGAMGGGPCPITQDPYTSKPCEDPDDICYCSGPKPDPKPPMVCRNMEQYCLHVPKGPSKHFEEIGSVLGGNELKIKVPAASSVIKKISQTHCAMQSPYMKTKPEGPCVVPCGKNKISLALPAEPICCNGLRPQGTQFTCTTEGCVQTPRHGLQAALARGDNKKYPAPNKDVFVLKVAKTSVEDDKKLKIEMELVTPKGPDKVQPVRKVDMRIATEPDCTCCCGGRMITHKGKKRR